MKIQIEIKETANKKAPESKVQPLIDGIREDEKQEQEREPTTEAVKVITMYIGPDGEISEQEMDRMRDIQKRNKPELVGMLED